MVNRIDLLRGLRLLSGAILLSSAGACTVQMGTVIRAKQHGEGIEATYPLSKDNVWPPIMAVLNWASAGQTNLSTSEGTLFTRFEGAEGKGTTFFGIWVEPLDEHQVKVTVVSRKVSAWVRNALSEDQFHEDLGRAVVLLKAGKPLPLVRPRGR